MRYLIRALKYFARMAVILVLIIFILVKMKMLDGNLDEMFVHGRDSLWQIAAILAAFSLLYPKFGYCTRTLNLSGPAEDYYEGISVVMENRGYRPEKEDSQQRSYVKKSPFDRALRIWEDRIVIRPVLGGFAIEGGTKDVVRLISALECRFTPPQEGV